MANADSPVNQFLVGVNNNLAAAVGAGPGNDNAILGYPVDHTSANGVPTPNIGGGGFNPLNALAPDESQARRHAKTYTRKGVLYYVGGGRVPKAEAARLRKQQVQAAAKKRQAQHRASKPKTAANRSGADRRSAASSMSASMDMGDTAPDLGSFGGPSTRNVSRIVDAIIADATAQARHGAQDARRQTLADLQSIAGGTVALDQLSQTAAAANKMYTDRQLEGGNAAAANQLAYLQQMRADLDAGGAGTPLEYAATTADAAGDAAAQQTEARQTGAANQAFFDMSRVANAQTALEAGRARRSQYAQDLTGYQRQIADARAKRAAIQMDVEKQLMDQHIAKKMAEAEWAQRGSNLQNDAVNRGATRTNAEANRMQMQQAKQERDWKINDAINGILLGIPTEYDEVIGMDDKGKPIKVRKTQPQGQAATWAEAAARIRLAGLGSYLPAARRLWDEMFNQRQNDFLINSGNMLGGLLGP